MIKVVLFYTVMNTRVKPLYTGKGKELMQFLQYVLFMGRFFYFNKVHINYTASHIIASCVSLSCLCNCYDFVFVCG